VFNHAPPARAREDGSHPSAWTRTCCGKSRVSSGDFVTGAVRNGGIWEGAVLPTRPNRANSTESAKSAPSRAEIAPSGPESSGIARLSGLVDAATLAQLLAVERAWVYEHASELGAIPLGSGPRPRLRFSVQLALERLNTCDTGRRSPAPVEPMAKPKARLRARRRSGTSVELLPIRGGRA
jgi:hypothetical protein